MYNAFALMIVSSVEMLLAHACLNYAARTYSMSSSSRYFGYFHRMEKGPHWIHLFHLLHSCPQLQLMWTLKVQTVMSHRHLFQYVHHVPLKYLITYINNFHYTGCPRSNVKYFRRVFLMLNYTDITQNTYIQS
jgi:hypothetical protein